MNDEKAQSATETSVTADVKEKKERHKNCSLPRRNTNTILLKQEKMSDSSKPLIVADPTKGIKVNAGVVAKPFREALKAKVADMKRQGLGKLTTNIASITI